MCRSNSSLLYNENVHKYLDTRYILTLEYLINREEAITVLIMVYPQKHNRLGPNKRTVY